MILLFFEIFGGKKMVLQQGVEFLGIVVSRKDYKERDMLVKILTDKYGFKTFFVRGVRKRGFKLGAAILPFTHGTYLGSISDEGLSFITTTRDISQYQQITQDIELNAYASYILSLVERALTTEDLVNLSWFLRVKKALELIDEGFDPAIITNIIEIQLLTSFGVRPRLESCVICQNTERLFDYSESYGGLLCQQHWHLDPHRLHLDQRTVYYLRLLSVVDLERLNSIKVKDQTKTNLRKTLDEIYEHQVGIYVPAKKFLDQMSSWDQFFKDNK